ncbi:hypothetical protein EDD18DRAFT_1141367 [Armillaria luteobubalina]|uniref:F-box domain-containing protein n=1 Tax=Armillaria luteobubalina TaxID=153913 RepID=A0AA39QGK3_9AGAR|nr:hypothetical protein EDD18DRAFT_1141367 [Armillaria luteobubalina]
MDLSDYDLHTSPFKLSVEEYLYDCDEEIARRRHLQQCINAHQGILSPIRTFPPEILAEIFMPTLDDNYDVFDTKRGPWVLGHVCRRWKCISRSYPALWTSFRRSDLPDILKEELDIRYSLQSLIIANDTLWVNYKSRLWAVLRGLFDTLIRHSLRWRSATFIIPLKLGRRLQKAKGRLLSLVSFDLSACDGLEEDGSFDRETIDMLSVAPELRMLTITSVPDNMLLSFSWSQMRHLYHDFEASIEDHLRLNGIPLLETYIASFHDHSHFEKRKLHCTHNYLRHLELSCPESPPTLLQYLTCPALEELSLDVDDVTNISQILYVFGDRSGCPLRELFVEFKHAGNLRLLDSLAHKVPGWDHDLFPKLEVLDITVDEGGDDTPNIFEQFTEIMNAHWSFSNPAGLGSMSLIINKDAWADSYEIAWAQNQLDLIHLFQEDGLDVTLTWNGKQEVGMGVSTVELITCQ